MSVVCKSPQNRGKNCNALAWMSDASHSRIDQPLQKPEVCKSDVPFKARGDRGVGRVVFVRNMRNVVADIFTANMVSSGEIMDLFISLS